MQNKIIIENEEEKIVKSTPFFKFQNDQDIKTQAEAGSIGQPPPPNNELEQPSQHQPHQAGINLRAIIFEDEDSNNEKGDQDKFDVGENQQSSTKKRSFLLKAGQVSLSMLLQLVFNLLIVYPILILFSLFSVCSYFCCKILSENDKKEFNEVISYLIALITCSSIMTVINTNDVYTLWYFESFILFLSHIMIYFMIEMTKSNNFNLKCNICLMFKAIFNIAALTYLYKEDNLGEIIMDIPHTKIKSWRWEYEYQFIIKDKFEVLLESQRFNTLCNKLKRPDVCYYIGYQFISGFEEPLKPNKVQFITLQCIMLLKIICCVYYLDYHSKLDWHAIFNVVVITIFSFNEVHCLNLILSHYDLRRKTVMSKNINSAIVINGDGIDYEKVVDITNSVSIETWDNSLRCVYEFFISRQKSLELNYICLFLYYLIVTNIILAAYGEIYLIISKESFLLNPLIVISSTFTFILLNTLILFRLYFGQKYNDTLDECEDTVDSIIGIYQDLIQQNDYNFTQRKITKQLYLQIAGLPLEEEEFKKEQDQLESNQKENEDYKKYDQPILNQTQSDEEKYVQQLFSKTNSNLDSCYDIQIAKFKYLSDYYIKKRIKFQGKVFTKQEEKVLQQKIMHNCLKSFKRIKQQVIIDTKLKSYQAFNIIKLDFQDTLFTISLGLLTLLPQIITKFIEQFKVIEHS